MSDSKFRWDLVPWLVCGVTFCLAAFLTQSCRTKAPAPPAGLRPSPVIVMNPRLLPGVWRLTHEGFDLVWTFEPDGDWRYQLQPHNSWVAFFGGGFDVRGRWRISGDQLTLELFETPPSVALAGANWSGQSKTFRILRLNSVELQLNDAELHFRRSQATPAARN